MAQENQTLATFYTSWKEYQDQLRDAIAPLTPEQLGLRAAPNLRSLGQLAAHIMGARIGWFTGFLGERGEEGTPLERWDMPDAPARSAGELAQGLDLSWNLMAGPLARWNADAMKQTFGRERSGKYYEYSRSWVIWHLLEHDLHHGGELSLTLGMHGLQAPAL